MSNLQGQIIRGYRLDEIAGVGGFGTVYHARQEVLNREVAIKVINEKYVNKPQFIRQFETEARIVARLEHLHIVPLYDYWRDPDGAYLIMRWINQGSLRGYLKRTQMTVPQIVRLLNQIASALSFGHQQNVIHRDIKPENILLDTTGNAFLTDFGIAVDLRSQDGIDIENISFGSPDYVAPEQLTQKLITPKADIYSLGIMLYELLAHERPFRAETAKEIMQMQLRNPVPSLRLTRPDLPTEIDTIIWQATSKRPESRYDSVLELAVAFQNIATSVTEVPSDYRILTEVRRKPLQKLAKRQDDSSTGLIDISETGVLDISETGILDDSSTGVLDMSETEDLSTGILDISGTDEDDPLATGALEDTDLSEIMATDSLDAMATNVLNEADIQESVAEGEANVISSQEEILESDTLMTIEIIGEGAPNPYKGLRAFEEGDADTFFGREEIVKQLLEHFSNPEKRFLGLLGSSGSGKSSIVRAGLIPQFRKGAILDSAKWFIRTMTPSNDPFREMSEALLRVSISAPENWGDILRQDVRGLHKLLGMILPEEDSQLVLFIDQFEEVFTQWDDDEQREIFLGSLWYAVNQPDSRIRIIITLRADFYDRPLNYPQFGKLLEDNKQAIFPLDEQELSASILGPANKVGLEIEPALVSALLQSVHNQAGALPLLQYTLTELYEQRNRDTHKISYDDYLKIGGISGALAKRSQEIYYNRLNENEQTIAKQLFLRIISVDENGTATRRRVLWQELMQDVRQDELEKVINAFSQYRLLTTDRDPVTRSPTIEVAHEAIINAWQELRLWIDENRYALQKRQEFQQVVDRWVSNGRETSYLVGGLRLAEFEGLRHNRLLALRKEEFEFIEAGIFEREADLRRTRRINNILKIFSGVVGVLAVIAVGLFVVARMAQQDAETQRDIAEVAQIEAETQRDIAEIAQIEAEKNARTAQSREIAASSLSLVETNDLSLLLAVEAINTTQTYEALNSLLVGLQQYPAIESYLQGHNGGVRAVDYNSTGTVAITAGTDDIIIRWDMSNRQMIDEPLQGHTRTINALSFSPDDSMIASAGADSTVRLWDAETGEELAIFEGHSATIWGLDFSPDGHYLATSDEAGIIIIWDVAVREVHRTIVVPDSIIFEVVFNADSTLLASGGGDNVVRLWDVVTGEAFGEPLIGHTNWVRALVFHAADPDILISGDLNSNLLFWRISTSQAIGSSEANHEGGIYDLAFHPRGYLASAGWDGEIRIWNMQTAQFVGQFAGHRARIWSIDFHPDDNVVLLSGSEDGGALVWQPFDVTHPGIGAVLAPGIAIDVFELHLDTGLIAVAGQDNPDRLPVIRVLDGSLNPTQERFTIPIDIFLTDGETIRLPFITDMAFSPDGTRLAALTTTRSDSAILVLDTETGEILWSELNYEGIPSALVFVENGSQLITSNVDGVVRLWDVETGEEISNNLSAQEIAGITKMAVSPDERILAISTRNHEIILWDLEAQEWIGEALVGHDALINDLLFDSSSEILYSGGDDSRVISWNVWSGELLHTFQENANNVLRIAISPDQTLMVSGHENGGLRLWDTKNGRAIGNMMTSRQGWVTGIFFTDERTILNSNRENRIILQWSVDIDNWIEQACSIANRSLTEDEQERFLPPELDYAESCNS